MKKSIVFFFYLFLSAVAMATEPTSVALQKPHIDLSDHASLQRGAKYYMNLCFGCHSLKHLRYSQMAKDLGIINQEGEVDKTLVENNLLFTDAKLGDNIQNALPVSDAKDWFGIVPPDLTLITRVRGSQWVYSYLMGFYQDSSRIWGTNNKFFPEVGMPNVLANLQGEQIASYQNNTLEHVQLLKQGQMSPREFSRAMNDLVNFLSYTAEPNQLQRVKIGIGVILFLCLFLWVAYLLKKEYWKIKK